MQTLISLTMTMTLGTMAGRRTAARVGAADPDAVVSLDSGNARHVLPASVAEHGEQIATVGGERARDHAAVTRDGKGPRRTDGVH